MRDRRGRRDRDGQRRGACGGRGAPFRRRRLRLRRRRRARCRGGAEGSGMEFEVRAIGARRLTRTLLLPGTAIAAAMLMSACSSVDPATKLTRELLVIPKEEAYAKGEQLVSKKKYETGRQYL